MDTAVVTFLISLAVLSALPAWVAGSVLKRHARQDGEEASEWVPFSILPYAFTRFRHKNRFAILWAYVFSNLVFSGAIVTLVILRFSSPG